MNFLVTAGPTREYLDPIRFISNPSSGRMGIAVAEQAGKLGHRVILILGPSTIQPPSKISLIRVETAAEMYKAVVKNVKWADVVVMAAAVGDWRRERKNKQKIKRKGKTLTLRLTANPDILAEVGRLKKRGKKIFLVGFSVDTKFLIENAKKKLKKKNLDLIVANPLDTFGVSRVGAVIINRRGEVIRLPLLSKNRLAGKLVRMIENFSTI